MYLHGPWNVRLIIMLHWRVIEYQLPEETVHALLSLIFFSTHFTIQNNNETRGNSNPSGNILSLEDTYLEKWRKTVLEFDPFSKQTLFDIAENILNLFR